MVTPCCLIDLPAECARCSKRAPEGEADGFIWVMDDRKWVVFCSPLCLVRAFVRRTG